MKMDCDGCERRIKNAVSSVKGLGFLLLFTIIIFSKLNYR